MIIMVRFVFEFCCLTFGLLVRVCGLHDGFVLLFEGLG